MKAASRYALYYTPEEGSEWARFGDDWFARVAESPRRYGFHATLKAPFRLAAGTSFEDLHGELERYCRAQAPWMLPALKVCLLGDFLALVPESNDKRVESIAAECVMRFDRFRAPLESEDLARRRPERLDPTELRMLHHWGYPYVLDLFRFHLSLTGPLGNADSKKVATLSVEASKSISRLGRPRFDAISVFEEPQPGADFRLVQRVEFSKSMAP